MKRGDYVPPQQVAPVLFSPEEMAESVDKVAAKNFVDREIERYEKRRAFWRNFKKGEFKK